MKKLFILSIFFVTIAANGQKKILALRTNHPITDTTAQPILFVISGESNAGGLADNGFASSPELAVRSIKILNNGNGTFEALHIGVNNISNHLGLPCCTTHGFELQIANSFDSGYFASHSIYMVKCGQGGSLISDWDNTDAFYDTMVTRVTRSVSLIRSQTGREPILLWLYSHGINDMIASNPAATWKAATETFFSNMRAEFDGIMGYSITVPIWMTRFNNMPTNLAYETVIGQIDSEVSDCVAVSTSDDLKDANHWQYNGMKFNFRQMLSTIQTFLNL